MFAEKLAVVVRLAQCPPAGRTFALRAAEADMLFVDVEAGRDALEDAKKVLIVEDVNTAAGAPTIVRHV